MFVVKTKERVLFRTTKCFVDILEYEGEISIELYSVRGKKLVATASVGLRVSVPPGYVAIKDYSENSGMLQALVEAKIVAEPSYYVPSGFVEIPVCEVLAEVVKYEE